MLYPAQTLLLDKILHNMPLLVLIGADGVLVHVVHQVEVKIVHAAFSQLILENTGGIIAAGDLVAGELVGQEKAVPGIGAEGLADGDLGHAAVVGVGGVKIVYSMPDGVGHHFVHLLLVDIRRCAAGDQGQAHGAETQKGQFFAVKITVYHM